MNQKRYMFFLLLFALSLFTGCGSKTPTDSSQKEVEYETPKILDITVREDATFENVDGCFVETRSDFLALGCPDWDGEILGVDTFPKLAERLKGLEEDMLFRQIEEHKNLMETAPYSDEEEIYFRSDTIVTRNDSAVVSFYNHIDYYDGYGGQEWLAVNIDPETGQELQMEDVFTDLNALSVWLAEELQAVYPDLQEEADLAEQIRMMYDEEMEFALSYGFVHFFFQEYVLPYSFGGNHVVLSLAEHPELVQGSYGVTPESYMLQMEYGTEILKQDGKKLRMDWVMDGDWSESVIWSMDVDGKIYTEEFYGYAPQNGYLIHKNGKDYFYLQEPAGDISTATNVYEVRSGVKKVGKADLGMHSLVNLNPERMLMDVNDILFMDGMHFAPYGLFCVDKEGIPVSVKGSEYGVYGSSVVAKETFRIYMTDPRDASVEEGFTTVAGQLAMKAFRTDMETYMDFLTEDGRAIRLTIDGWNDEMELYGGSLLTDVVEADPNNFEW